MKIVHITDYFNEKVAYQENMLTLGQLELGHDVSVLTSDLLIEIADTKNNRIRPIGTSVHEGIKIIRTAHTIELKKNSLLHYRSVLKNLLKINPDYIFIHDKGLYIFSILFYKIFFKKKVIIRMDFHSDFTNSMNSKFGKYYHFFFRIIFKFFDFAFDKYYYIAPEMGDFIKKIYNLPPNKCELLRLPGNNNHVVDKTKKEFRKIWKLNEKQIYFLHSGKLPEGKKTIELIKAVEFLDAKLIICGSITGNGSQILEDLIRITSNVEYKGWVNPNQLRELIKACDALVQPGTLSNTFVEAVCIGTPLILANSPMARDLICANNGIILKNTVTPENIKQALTNFIINKDEFQTSAKDPVSIFNYKTISKQTLEI